MEFIGVRLVDVSIYAHSQLFEHGTLVSSFLQEAYKLDELKADIPTELHIPPH